MIDRLNSRLEKRMNIQNATNCMDSLYDVGGVIIVEWRHGGSKS